MIHYFEEPTDDSLSPCGICNRNIGINHKFVKCIICNYKIHIKCNKTDAATFEKNKKNSDHIYCLKCLEEIIPFQNLSDEQFYMTSEKGIQSDIDQLNLSILPNNSLRTFFKVINKLSCNITDDLEINCNYVDIDSFCYRNTKDFFSLFHLNIAYKKIKKNWKLF